MFIVPVEMSTFVAVCYQHVERCCKHAEVVNIHAIKIEKTEKCM